MATSMAGESCRRERPAPPAPGAAARHRARTHQGAHRAVPEPCHFWRTTRSGRCRFITMVHALALPGGRAHDAPEIPCAWSRAGALVPSPRSPMIRCPSPNSAAIAVGLLWPVCSQASIHADLSALSVVLLPVMVLKEASPLALLLAAYLLWKKHRAGWLFAYIALSVSLSVISRIFVAMSAGAAPLIASTLYPSLTMAYVAMHWLLLAVAMRVSRIGPGAVGGAHATSQATG